MRRLVSIALVVLATLFLLPGGILLYAREEVFDDEAFADRAVLALDDEDARQWVTDRLVDQITEQGTGELVAAKPILQSVVSGALETGALRSLLRAAALNGHRALFERDRGSVVVDVANAGKVLISAAKAVAPQIADEIPTDIEPTLTKIGRRDFFATSLVAAEGVREGALFFMGVALLLYGLSIAVARERRGAVVRVGVSISVASVAGFVALLAGRSAALGALDEDTDRLALDAAWDVLLGDLQTACLIAGAAGLILAAAASSVLQPFEVAGRAQRLRDLAGAAPTSTSGRLLRAAAVLAASVLLVADPTYALEVVTVVVGAYGLFFATSEILAVVTKPPPPREQRAEARARRALPAGRFAAIAGSVAAVVLSGGIAAAAVTGTTGGGSADSQPDRNPRFCNGFRQLCDRPYNEVAVAASHNAMAAAESPGWLFAHHRGDISEQLEFGIRGFLIDAYYGYRDEGGSRVRTDLSGTNRKKLREQLGDEGLDAAERLSGSLVFGERPRGARGLYLCHILCELGATPMAESLGQIRDFMARHPDEVITIVIEDYVQPRDIARAFEEAGLLRYMYRHKRDGPFPTLRRMIRSNQRLQVMAEKDYGDGEVDWYDDAFDLMQETPYSFKNADELEAARSCRPNRGTPESPLFQLNHWIEALPVSPGKHRTVNDYPFLLARADACKREREVQPNLVAVNWYDLGDLLPVVNVLNGIPPNDKARLPTR